MTKVLFFHHYNDFSGSTKVLADYLVSQFEDLSKVEVVTDTSKNGFLTDIGVKLINVPILRYKEKAIPLLSQILWPFTGFFKALIYGWKYDVFYINTIVPMYAAIAGSLLGKKIIYHVHEKYITKSIKSRLAEFVFNHVIAERKYVSKYVSDSYAPHKGCVEYVEYNKLTEVFISKVYIVPVGEHKLNEALMISSLQAGKGVDNFMKIAFLLPNVHFSLVLSATKERIENYFDYNLPTNVTVYPSQPNIHPFLEKADIILNLSIPDYLVETFGMTIIEGMAYGLPAVVPNVGGPIELVENGINGYSIDVTNVSLVANKIKEILNPETYKMMYLSSLKKIEQFKY